jgi:single-stranded DNA-binding protein
MAFGRNRIDFTGRVTKDPELRTTPTGKQVWNFTLADTVQRKDQATGKYVDDYTIFMPCQVWNRPAENAAASCRKGEYITVIGSLKKSPDYQDKQTGEMREGRLYISVEEFCLNLQFDPAHSERQPGQGSSGGGYQQNHGGGNGYQGAQQQQFQQPQPPASGFGFGGNYDETPPF